MIKKQKINLNGKVKEIQCIQKNGNNFVKLQDIADGLISVSYDGMPVISLGNGSGSHSVTFADPIDQTVIGKNFDRQYRFAAGKAGSTGFEIGGGKHPLHITFTVEKADTESQNTAKVEIWNLSDQHIAELSKSDCIVSLRAGYGNIIGLVFAGVVSYAKTRVDNGDRVTEIECVDSRIEIRDTYISVGYSGLINTKTILQDAADKMGVAVSFSYNATFVDIPNGFSYVGSASGLLTKVCSMGNLTWSINNGVLQIKRPGDTMSKEVYILSAETGVVNTPEKVDMSDNEDGYTSGWDVEYLMNAAINIDDYVYLDTKTVKGYFRVYSVCFDGDNYGSSWTCTARLLEV